MPAQAWPVVNQFTVSGLVAGTAKAAQNAWLANSKMLPGGAPRDDINTSANAVTPDVSIFRVDTPSGTFPIAINRMVPTNFVAGMMVIVGIVSSSRPHTFKHNQGGSGNILNASGTDILVDNSLTRIIYQLDGSGNWN